MNNVTSKGDSWGPWERGSSVARHKDWSIWDWGDESQSGPRRRTRGL